MCDIYPSNKKHLKTADELRYLLFCQKKQRNELLPPTSDSLRQHINRLLIVSIFSTFVRFYFKQI